MLLYKGYSNALSGFSASSYKLTNTFVNASMTPARSKYFLNSSLFESMGWNQILITRAHVNKKLIKNIPNLRKQNIIV